MTAPKPVPKPESKELALAVETRAIEMGDGSTAYWIDRADGTTTHFRVRQSSPPNKLSGIGDKIKLLFIAVIVIGFIVAAVLTGGDSDSSYEQPNVVGGYELPG